MTTNAANQHRTGLHFIAKQNERINKYDEINESAAWQTMYCHFLTKSKVNFVCSTSKNEKKMHLTSNEWRSSYIHRIKNNKNKKPHILIDWYGDCDDKS